MFIKEPFSQLCVQRTKCSGIIKCTYTINEPVTNCLFVVPILESPLDVFEETFV